jgi:DNA-directed RNA polymerase specialized sigma24 family protein
MADADQGNRDADCQSDKWSDEEKRKRYRAAFATLPRFTQKVFWGHRIDDLSYADIAKRYGIGIRDVEREIARAIYGIDRALAAMDRKPRMDWWPLRLVTRFLRR